ncbi:MAG: hypothetical protein K2N65_04380, partial [Anaeroplasmataceae bacterium]|nr:hypothetical protein [Anaeroplasmataceae bacterium]
IACLLLLFMASCSGYSFYDDFHKAGADIEKDHIFEVITLEEAKQKKENGDTFVLLYGTSSNTGCVQLVTKLQAQAEYLGNTDAVIYYLNSAEYTSSTKRTEVREAINMHDPSKDGAPVVMIFTKAPSASRVDVDTSFTESSQTKKFMESGSIQYSSLASYIFKEILVK